MLDSPQKVDYNFYKSPKKLDNEVFSKLLERKMRFGKEKEKKTEKKIKRLEKKIKQSIYKYPVHQIVDALRSVLDSEESRVQKEYETNYNAFTKILEIREVKEYNRQKLTRKEIRQGNSISKKGEKAESKLDYLAELKSIFFCYNKKSC